MLTRSLTTLAVAIGGLAISLTAGTGVASADPDLGPMINSTCTYPQTVAALNAQNPAAAAIFSQSPQTQTFLKQFIAAGPDQRLAMAQQVENSPTAKPYFPVIQQMFATCSRY
jgi:hemophore-related protein